MSLFCWKHKSNYQLKILYLGTYFNKNREAKYFVEIFFENGVDKKVAKKYGLSLV